MGGYAIGLPGTAAESLLILACYARKDARTPLLAGTLWLIIRVGLILLLLKPVTGPLAIMVIPLAVSVTESMDALLLGVLVFRRLRTLALSDPGLQRLSRWRARPHATCSER